jgi:hypothetical protein
MKQNTTSLMPDIADIEAVTTSDESLEQSD